MQEFKISEVTKQESIYKALGLVFGIIITVVGFINLKFNYIIIGILLLFYFTYSKTIFLTNMGVEYRYNGFLFRKVEYLNYSSIDGITIVKGRTESSIFFIREPMAKKVVVINDRIDEIIKHIKDNTEVPVTYK